MDGVLTYGTLRRREGEAGLTEVHDRRALGTKRWRRRGRVGDQVGPLSLADGTT